MLERFPASFAQAAESARAKGRLAFHRDRAARAIRPRERHLERESVVADLLQRFPVFIENVFPGDLAEVRLNEVKKGFARGELVRLVSPSPLRLRSIS